MIQLPSRPSDPIVIAEIGCTHVGKMDRAKKLIKMAASCGVSIVKLQKRNPKESVPKEWWDKPHPNQSFAYGKTYLEHRINIELSIENHAELQRYCNDLGVKYGCSVWDMTSLKEIIDLNPSMIKIPSPCNHRYDMIDYLYNNYRGYVHISLGMTTQNERDKLIDRVKNKTNKESETRTILYHCVSGYPVPFNQLYMLEIAKLYSASNDNRFFHIGFSDHGYGIAMEPAGYVLGARYFERHFIDDRMFPHSDSAASLEMAGLQKVVRDLCALQAAYDEKPKDITEIELIQRNKLRS